jgi:hypothetical protein
MVLWLLGFDPDSEPGERRSATPPFALNTAELFEQYTEALLREQYPDLEASYEEMLNPIIRSPCLCTMPGFHGPPKVSSNKHRLGAENPSALWQRLTFSPSAHLVKHHLTVRLPALLNKGHNVLRGDTVQQYTRLRGSIAIGT